MQDKLIKSRELAGMLDVAPVTVRSWRMRGIGPPFLKQGNLVRYRLSAVERWISKNTNGESAS
jgi:phage terminase Nu1 subunit (DNA packaging protein)